MIPSLVQVCCVTFNPAIDLTIFVDHLVPGTVHRATRSHRHAGGKGVNVATLLSLGGLPVAVSGFLGEANAPFFETHFRAHNLQDAFVRVPGETRTCIKIVDTDPPLTTDLNSPGLAPSAHHCERLCATLLSHARPGVWFVFSGSLPPGLELDFFADLLRALRAAGARIAVDTSGPALAVALDVGVDLAKPNLHELADYLGRPLPDMPAAVAAARALHHEKASHLVVSLGSEGAVFFSPEAELFAAAPPARVASTVGAGDALLAGYLRGLIAQDAPDDRARLATVYAWSSLESLERILPGPAVLAERLNRTVIKPLAIA